MAKKFQLNILSIIGTLIGIIAIFLPWLQLRIDGGLWDYNLIHFFDTASFWGLFTYQIACLMFIGGWVLSIISPLGAIPEIMGVSIFYVEFNLEPGNLPINTLHFLGLGFYVGFFAAIILIVSMMRPIIWNGHCFDKIAMKNRLLNFVKINGKEN